MPSMKVISMEILDGIEREEIPLHDSPAIVLYHKRARFVVALGDERREVIAERSCDENGVFDPKRNARWDSISRPVICKFRSGTKLWPNQLNLWEPTAQRREWSVNCPPITNSNRFFIVGWNDTAIDDRYFSRHIGARAR